MSAESSKLKAMHESSAANISSSRESCIIDGYSDVQVCRALGDGLVAMKYLRDELKLGFPHSEDIERVEKVQNAVIESANGEFRED